MSEVGLVYFGIFAIVWFGGIVWVYRNAASNGQHKWLWTIGMILFWLPTLVVYVVWTHRQEMFSEPGGQDDVRV